MDIDLVFHLFLEDLKTKHYSKETLSSYRSDSDHFRKFLMGQNMDAHLDHIDSNVIRRYVLWMNSQGYAPETIKRKIKTLNVFFDYLEKQNMATLNPFAALGNNYLVQWPMGNLIGLLFKVIGGNIKDIVINLCNKFVKKPAIIPDEQDYLFLRERD